MNVLPQLKTIRFFYRVARGGDDPRPWLCAVIALSMKFFVGVVVTPLLLLTACAGSSEPSVVTIAEPLTVEVFAAADVDESVTTAIEESLALATDMWGMYWPVEYWVLGLDPDAGVALVEDFCSRRDSLGQWDYASCMDREAGSQQHSMIEYQTLGAEAFAAKEPFGTAGRNGTAEWGIHRYASTLPWGLSGNFGIPGAEDVKTVFHEYWHAVQHSFITTLDWDERDAAMGPVWFVEGSAEYMAQYATAQLLAEGTMPSVPAGDWAYDPQEQMRYKLMGIDDALSGECSGRDLVSIVEYSDPCSYLGYDMGAWAIAYLTSLTSQDVLLAVFHPSVEELGFEEAFAQASGMTLKEFSADFMTFAGGSEADRMAILQLP
jgi:hypothetical protein